MLDSELVEISDKFPIGKDIYVITKWIFIKPFGISEQFPKGLQEVHKKFTRSSRNKYHFVNVGKMALKLSCINLKKMHNSEKAFEKLLYF